MLKNKWLKNKILTCKDLKEYLNKEFKKRIGLVVNKANLEICINNLLIIKNLQPNFFYINCLKGFNDKGELVIWQVKSVYHKSMTNKTNNVRITHPFFGDGVYYELAENELIPEWKEVKI